jgi:NAD(P)H:quinone oxidoreductase type IV
MNIYVIFYSEHGHVFRLAQAIAEGAQSVDGASVRLFQTEKLAPDEVLEQSGAMEPRKLFAHVPVITAWELAGADAVIFGTPAKFGMMAASMRNLLDQTGPLWADGALLGKVGSVFTSTTTQQGGQESTVTSFHDLRRQPLWRGDAGRSGRCPPAERERDRDCAFSRTARGRDHQVPLAREGELVRAAIGDRHGRDRRRRFLPVEWGSISATRTHRPLRWTRRAAW